MNKMALLFSGLYGGGVAAALLHPIYPLLAYLIFYYLPPHLNWWGRDLPDLRYSLTASIAIVLSLIIARGNLEPLNDERDPGRPWLVLFGVNCVLVTIGWALSMTRSWAVTVTVLKLVLLFMVLPAAIRTPAQFDTFGSLHVAGAAYWGYKAWDDPHREAGRLLSVGGPDTQNDNQAAGHLLTVLPFAALYVLTTKRRVVQALFAVAAAFIINVFILCNSRGATVGLVVAGVSAILLAGKGRRSRLIAVAVAGAAALLFLADPQFIQRQQTTTDPQDSSAQSRIISWRAGGQILRDYPFGGGGRTFHILSPRYIPDIVAAHRGEERSPHNSYVQLATDWGVQGTVLFLGFLFVTLKQLHDIRKRTPANHWYVYRALATEVALVGTMSAATFSNRLYGESIYWMCALAFALHRLQSTELAGSEPEKAPALQRVTTPAPLRDAAAVRQRQVVARPTGP
jgi:hypothetical protein